MILANRKPTDGGLLIDYDFKVSLEDNELIIKSSVISGFNKMHRAVFDQEGPDQSAIKKYLPSKPYFKRKRRECFEAYGKGGRVQMRSHVLHLDQLPEEQRDYFTSIAPKSMSYAEAEN